MMEILRFLADDIGPVGLIIWASIAMLVIRPGPARWLGAALWLAATPGPAILAWQAMDQATVGSIDDLSPDSGAGAVVVLGGGAYFDGRGLVWPREAASLRALVGVSAARRLNLPILYSGGVPRADMPVEAPALARLLPGPVETIIEDRSRNTYENAIQTKALLAERGIDRIVLVTSAKHSWRAEATFRSAGLDLAEIITVSPKRPPKAADWAPRPAGIEEWYDLSREWVGATWYAARGWIRPDLLL